MISFLTSPKPFTGISKSIQLNSIRSWLNIFPENEVLLYGDTEGIEDISWDYKVKRIKNVQTNEYGTPLFNAIAYHAKKYAKYDLQAYINCDIILTPNFISTLHRIKFYQFMMIGQRLDLSEGINWNHAVKNWRRQIMELSVASKICLHSPSGSDYFAFKRGLWDDLPPITIGRGGYDNALIKFVLEKRIPVIDATMSVLAIHQFHDYGHMVRGRQEVFEGPEAIINRGYAGNHGVPTLTDATWVIDNHTCSRNYSRGDWMRFLECQSRFVYRSEFLGFFCRQLRRILLRLGFSKQKKIHKNDLMEGLSGPI